MKSNSQCHFYRRPAGRDAGHKGVAIVVANLGQQDVGQNSVATYKDVLVQTKRQDVAA
ncbi:hypothetical protein J8TS2_35090 [Lederbergia ruris]|uniref:Uncharacterized protein n=1 Tax=Lederbergia ruris TaxID=217495 RepID=A0ABQ4KMP0_9BACI|nr:hypothetical protein J8TS2_35090 [Lederbergia ruris]